MSSEAVEQRFNALRQSPAHGIVSPSSRSANRMDANMDLSLDSRVLSPADAPLPGISLSATDTASKGDCLCSWNSLLECRTVLLAERGLFRAGLKQMLQKHCIPVIGEGRDITGLLDAMQTQPIPELVICHVESDRNDENPLGVITDLRRHFPQANLVVLADSCTRSLLANFALAEVNAILLTSISSEVLLSSLKLVLAGQLLLPAEILSLIADSASAQPSPGPAPTKNGIMPAGRTIRGNTNQIEAPLEDIIAALPQLTVHLSQRERQVMQCLVSGLSNKQIARELDIVEGTVKVYLKLLSRKIKVTNRTQLAIWAQY
jgi:two-component system, NarL family, nitrate/nitrite response regulator NarL